MAKKLLTKQEYTEGLTGSEPANTLVTKSYAEGYADTVVGDEATARADADTALQSDIDTKAAASALASHVSNTSNPHNVTKAQIGLGNVENTSDASKPVSTATQTALDAKQNALGYTPENAANKGIANGYASLGSDGKLATAQIPDAVLGALKVQGVWNASTNSPTIPTASNINKGWYYIVQVAGTTNIDGITDWQVGDWIVSQGTSWTKIDNTDSISSWNGRTGAITPQTGDYNSDQVTEGNTNLYHTAARVRAVVLTGIDLVTNAVISATDSILSALGKLQAQITGLNSTVTTNTANIASNATAIATKLSSSDASVTNSRNRRLYASSYSQVQVTNNAGVEQLLASITIAAGDAPVGSSIEIITLWSSSGSAGAKLQKVYLNNANNLTGATLYGTYSYTANGGVDTLTRIYMSGASTQKGKGPSTANYGYGTVPGATGTTTSAYTTANAKYIHITGTRNSGSDTLYLETYEIYINQL